MMPFISSVLPRMRAGGENKFAGASENGPLVGQGFDLYAARMNEQSTGFIREDPWRIFRIMAEFVDSFETLSHLGHAVTIFGSARTPPGEPMYQAALTIGKELAKNHLAVITGGGPGIMESAN